MIVTLLAGADFESCPDSSHEVYEDRIHRLQEFKSALLAQKAVEEGRMRGGVFGVFRNKGAVEVADLYRAFAKPETKGEVLPDELWITDKFNIVRKYIPSKSNAC